MHIANLSGFAISANQNSVRPKSLDNGSGIIGACVATMTPDELRKRTRRFAVAIVALCRTLPAIWTVRTLARQLLRSGTSVGANYRSACRGRSSREFCAKIGIVADEADESLFWLELVAEAWPRVKTPNCASLVQEADELTAIFTASHQTAKTNLEKRRRRG